MKQFGTNTLLQTVMQRTGLTDFGTPDFMDGLNAFVNGLNNPGDIKEDRWDQAFEYILRLFMNRLWVKRPTPINKPKIAMYKIYYSLLCFMTYFCSRLIHFYTTYRLNEIPA